MQAVNLVSYHRLGGIEQPGQLPPITPGGLYELWETGSGDFIRARRTGLEVMLPLQLAGRPDLTPAAPYVKLDFPPVPGQLLEEMLGFSRQASDRAGRPLEMLFHVSWNEERAGWRLEVPPQVQRRASVRPTWSGADSSYQRALLEVHSHHRMDAYFSATDDRDEGRSFRLFAVLGRIFERQPHIRLRAGLFGRFWEIPAGWVFELPGWVSDCVSEEEAIRTPARSCRL